MISLYSKQNADAIKYNSVQQNIASQYDGKVKILDNPVLQDILLTLRDKNTDSSTFRTLIHEAGKLMTFEILGYPGNNVLKNTQTPMGHAQGTGIDKRIYITEILRAAAPFTEGGIELIDKLGYKRDIAVIDAKRLESDNGPDENGMFNMKVEFTTFKAPPIKENSLIIVADPMLATGTTQILTLDKLAKFENYSYPEVLCFISVLLQGVKFLFLAYNR